MEVPVRVTTSAGAAMFPEAWRRPPILASGEVLPETEHARVRAILARALAKYPPAVLETHLKGIHVLAELRYSGVITSGTNSRTCVYLKIGDARRGYTEEHIEGVFHAEFSSILLRNCAGHLDKAAWEAVNPPGFRYLGHGVAAVKQNKAGLVLLEALHERGFLVEYAQSTLENDFNGFAKMLFNGEAALWEVAARHPPVRRKLDRVLAFYQALDADFTEAGFRKLAAP